ncbi:glycosyltransferase family 9 protein [bacterium]|nr:glycosyltransferase family 9 protein [bacterium]
MKATGFENILVLRLGGIGDAIVSLPALRALREGFPESKITIACQNWLKEIFKEENVADEFIVFDALFSAGRKDLLNPRIWRQLFSLTRILLQKKWHILILLHKLYSFTEIIKPLLFSFLTRSPVRVGMDGSGRGFFLTHRLRYNRYGRKHYIDIIADTVELLGIKVRDRTPILRLREEEKEVARKFLEEIGLNKNSLLVGYCPTGRRKTRWWDWNGYVEVLRWVESEYRDCYFLLTIGREEAAERFFKEKLGEKLIVARGMPIRYLAGVMQKCNLFISNDTGPMHLAFAVGVPTIGLFGPAEWQKWAYNDEKFFAIHHMVDCWPCYKDICDKGHTCMKKISVEEVIEKVKIALEGKWEDRW